MNVGSPEHQIEVAKVLDWVLELPEGSVQPPSDDFPHQYLIWDWALRRSADEQYSDDPIDVIDTMASLSIMATSLSRHRPLDISSLPDLNDETAWQQIKLALHLQSVIDVTEDPVRIIRHLGWTGIAIDSEVLERELDPDNRKVNERFKGLFSYVYIEVIKNQSLAGSVDDENTQWRDRENDDNDPDEPQQGNARAVIPLLFLLPLI